MATRTAKIKRLAVWAVELIVQANLLIVLMIVLFGPTGTRSSPGDWLALATLILLSFCLTGYAIGTALTRVFWDDNRRGTYAVCCVAMFCVHFGILKHVSSDSSFTATLWGFFAGGMGITAATSFAGDVVLARWE